MSHTFLLSVSILLFIAFLLFSAGKFRGKPWQSGALILLSGGWVLLASLFVAIDYFTNEGINQAAIYHLQYGLAGAGFGEYWGLILGVLVTFLLSLFGVFYVLFYVRNYFSSITVGIVWSFLVLSVLSNPAFWDFYRFYDAGSLSPESAEEGLNNQKDFYERYKGASFSENGLKKKNIIHIYVESLEQNYFDEALFPNLLPELSKISKKSVRYTNIQQVYGTGWTIAGITASQCGIPLVTPSHGNSMSGMKEFLPGAQCLGDKLKEFGYSLNFMGGAKLEFAGKGKFFSTHGYESVNGLEFFQRQGYDKEHFSAWGVNDDKLMEQAFSKYLDLKDKKEQFALTMLTLGTHHPRGHMSKSCEGMTYGDGQNEMLNAVHCTDKVLAEFINAVQSVDVNNETVIVISSDHLAMRNTAWDKLNEKPRKNFLMVVDSDSSPEINDKLGSSLDVATTILDYIGFSGKVGFGEDLEKSDDAVVLKVQHTLPQWKSALMKLWGFPKLEGDTKIDVDDLTVELSEELLNIPVLIEVKPDLNTVARFDFNRSKGHKKFSDHIMEFNPVSHFFWVDKCKKVPLYFGKDDDGFCVAFGKNNKVIKTEVVSGKEVFTVESLKERMGMNG